jgi:hypothetical protein
MPVNKAAIRMGNNKVVTLYKFAYPTMAVRTFDYKIVLTGKGHIDGIVYYNGLLSGASYDGTPAAKPVTIQHLAIGRRCPWL